MGFPMYVTIDRKPDNGEDIQNSTCGRSGIMMRFRIANSANNEEDQLDDRDNLPHVTKVMKELVMPWYNRSRIVCADSYFASVPDAEE